MANEQFSHAGPTELLDQMLATAGEERAGDDVTIAGADPVLPTPFRIGEVGAAAIAAAAVGAARLWEAKTGRTQRIHVDVDAAALALRSYRHLQCDPPPPPDSGRVGYPYHRTADDRWLFIRGGFAHHYARAMEALGCPLNADDDTVAKAVAGWNAFDAEEALIAAGSAGCVVRSSSEWALHEQGRAIASLPLFEIEKIGDSEPIPLPAGDRPLSGIRALDITRVIAGPACGRSLAEHGADVLRVGTSLFPDTEVMFRDGGHGKRSVELNLKSKEGVGTLRKLLVDADVFSQGYRPGAIANLGFSPEEAVQLRPGLIYISENAFGRIGPWRDRRGFDTVAQGVSGMSHEGADPATGRPSSTPAEVLDYTTGYLMAFAAMVALRRRAEEGGSYLVRTSLSQAARFVLGLSRVVVPEEDPSEGAVGTGDALMTGEPARLSVPDARIQDLMIERDTPFGHLRYLGPAARLSETPGRWERPTVPLDHDQPAWLTA